jgi:heptose-I-phosphate ethanolaminephosphotransferase
MCGIFDIESNHFKTCNSLAHNEYSHTRESLTIMEGEIRLTEDKERLSNVQKQRDYDFIS